MIIGHENRFQLATKPHLEETRRGFELTIPQSTEGITPEVTPEDTPEVTPEVSASGHAKGEEEGAKPHFDETRHGFELTIPLSGEQVTEQVAEQATVQVPPLLRDLVAQRSRNTIFVTSRKWSRLKRAAGEVRGEATGEVAGEVIAFQNLWRARLHPCRCRGITRPSNGTRFFVAIICTRHATSYGTSHATSRDTSQQTGFREPKVMKAGHKEHKNSQK